MKNTYKHLIVEAMIIHIRVKELKENLETIKLNKYGSKLNKV